MAYRNDVEALEARHQVLEAEVANRVRERDEVATMLREAREGEAAERHFASRMSPGLRRRRQRRVLVVMALVLGTLAALAGFKYEARHEDRTVHSARVAQAFTHMYLWTSEICACTTTDCVNRITDTMTKWSTSHAADAKSLEPYEPDEIKHLTALGQHLAECMMRVYSATGQLPQ